MVGETGLCPEETRVIRLRRKKEKVSLEMVVFFLKDRIFVMRCSKCVCGHYMLGLPCISAL